MRSSRSEEEVLGAIDALAERGEVVSRSFPVRDPHLAFSSLRFVAAVDPAAGARQADVHTERAYRSWLREWLSSPGALDGAHESGVPAGGRGVRIRGGIRGHAPGGASSEQAASKRG